MLRKVDAPVYKGGHTIYTAGNFTMGLFSGTRPHGLGVRNGKLKAAPSSPNAVSSQSTEKRHAIAPLAYTGTREEVIRKLRSIIGDTPRARIVVESPDYLHVEYESALLGFIDDVEFYLPAYEKAIQVRSASRIGYSDFGVNRKRIENVRARLTQAGA